MGRGSPGVLKPGRGALFFKKTLGKVMV